jgi:transcriptional regulator with XRE-family HTH domain
MLISYIGFKVMSTVQPSLTYNALIGQIIQRRRKQLSLDQSVLANGLGISQPAYSRLESGNNVISLIQLRKIASLLKTRSFEILHEAEKLEYELQKQGVSIIAERDAGISPAAAMIGVGLLLALFAQ